MIRINNNKKIISMYLNGLNVLSVYTLGQLLWPEEVINKILSCFYSSYWIDEHPWTDDTPWTD